MTAEFQATARPPVPPGAEFAAIFELPQAAAELRASLTRRAGAIDLVKDGARFVVVGRRDDGSLGVASIFAEAHLLNAVSWLYDRAAKQGRTSCRCDYWVTDPVLARLRALEAELPKQYAGAPAVN